MDKRLVTEGVDIFLGEVYLGSLREWIFFLEEFTYLGSLRGSLVKVAARHVFDSYGNVDTICGNMIWNLCLLLSANHTGGLPVELFARFCYSVLL
jgi:hypothetical protein